MFELTKEFVEGLGVQEMPEAEMKAFLAHLQEEMEVRVGERISAEMSEAQVDEFEKLIDENADDQTTMAWLDQNCPQYKEIVQNVIAELKEEIKAGKDKI